MSFNLTIAFDKDEPENIDVSTNPSNSIVSFLKSKRSAQKPTIFTGKNDGNALGGSKSGKSPDLDFSFVKSPTLQQDLTQDLKNVPLDLFGLGTFESTFEEVTPIKRDENGLKELLKFEWKGKEMSPIAHNVVLLFKNVSMGTGMLGLSDDEMIWKGTLVDSKLHSLAWSRTNDWKIESMAISLGAFALQFQLRQSPKPILEKIQKFAVSFTPKTNAPITKPTNTKLLDDIKARYQDLRDLARQRRDALIKEAEQEYQATLTRLETEQRDSINAILTPVTYPESPALDTSFTNVPGTPATPNDKTCQLCFDDSVSQVLEPCGHKMCKSCLSQWKSSSTNCPWDRTIITGIKDIYLSRANKT